MHSRLKVASTAPSMGLLDFQACHLKSLFMALLVGRGGLAGGGLAVNRSHGLDSGKHTETQLSARALINPSVLLSDPNQDSKSNSRNHRQMLWPVSGQNLPPPLF